MVAVGLAPDGSMDAPQVGDAIAWYSLGPLPGSTGNAVLAGHVDWDKRPAVFWRLRELEPGDEMTLEFSDGSSLTYRVQWSEQYQVGAEPLGRVYENLTVSALTLITCTGEFDRGSRGYRDRLVVRAVRG